MKVMKKVLLLILLLLTPFVTNAREYELYCSIGDVSTGGPFFEDENIRFEFSYIPWSYYLKVRIKNKTDERVYVEWENFRLSDKQICFRSDNYYSFNNNKQDEVIHSNSSSEKEIRQRIDPELMAQPFSESLIKRYGESVMKVIIPIRNNSGEVKDYKMYVCLKEIK